MKLKICFTGLLCPVPPRKKYHKYLKINLLSLLCFLSFTLNAQDLRSVEGTVISVDNKQPLSGAYISLDGKIVTQSDNSGAFHFSTPDTSGRFSVSYVGYNLAFVSFGKGNIGPFHISLLNEATLSEVVVSTGYQTIPKDRASGSFDQIDNKLLNRNASDNILDRLNGIASGLRFNGDANPSVATGSGS